MRFVRTVLVLALTIGGILLIMNFPNANRESAKWYESEKEVSHLHDLRSSIDEAVSFEEAHERFEKLFHELGKVTHIPEYKAVHDELARRRPAFLALKDSNDKAYEHITLLVPLKEDLAKVKIPENSVYVGQQIGGIFGTGANIASLLGIAIAIFIIFGVGYTINPKTGKFAEETRISPAVRKYLFIFVLMTVGTVPPVFLSTQRDTGATALRHTKSLLSGEYEEQQRLEKLSLQERALKLHFEVVDERASAAEMCDSLRKAVTLWQSLPGEKAREVASLYAGAEHWLGSCLAKDDARQELALNLKGEELLVVSLDPDEWKPYIETRFQQIGVDFGELVDPHKAEWRSFWIMLTFSGISLVLLIASGIYYRNGVELHDPSQPRVAHPCDH